MANLSESQIEIATPDGVTNAFFVHPNGSSVPGVLIWPDAGGLRPVLEDLARNLAREGYAVLVPNLFYRTKKPAIDFTTFDFSSPADRERLAQFTTPILAPGAPERDASSYLKFLRSSPAVDSGRPLGVQGYCLGGPLTLRTAAAFPDEIGAAASFHGGGLVTDQPTSPHRLAPQMRARLYIAVAGNDHAKQPDALDTLRESFASAHLDAEVELYPDALHGWCIFDMPPMPDGTPLYNAAAASHSWSKLLELYRKSL